MTEGGRHVALEEVMPHPGRKIARERRAEEPRPASGDQRGEGDREREQRAADVQAARDRVAVLAEVIGIELAKVGGGRRTGADVTAAPPDRGPQPPRSRAERARGTACCSSWISSCCGAAL